MEGKISTLQSPLLTEEEAVKWLRLDVDGPADPRQTLKYYRARGLLRGCRVGKRVRYPVCELEALVARLVEREARRA